MDQIKEHTQEVYMPKAELVIVGRAPVGHEGEHQIKSKVETDEQVRELFESSIDNMVEVTNKKCAVCIDGRCAACTGADLQLVEDDARIVPLEIKKPEVLAHVPGGMFHFATMMAIAGNAALVQGAETYNEAKAVVAAHLTELGYEDAIHTSVLSFESETGTECGAIDKIEPALEDAIADEKASDEDGVVRPVGATVATLYGKAEVADEFCNSGLYREVTRTMTDKLARNLFEGYSPTANRDGLLQSNPHRVELLESDKDHPTHLHEEQGILINEKEGYTIDRDQNGGRLFVYDRWMTKQLAADLAGTPNEQERLLMAGDYVTVVVANKLVAPGMPVAVAA